MYPPAPGAYGIAVSSVPEMPLDPCQQDQLDVLENQRRLTSWPYYSTVKFRATRTEDAPGGPYQWNIARGEEVRAFAYRVGQDKRIAGYTLADGNATFADTNLTQASQTTGGQNVLIHGLALQLMPAMLDLEEDTSPPHVVRLPDASFLSALYEAVEIKLTLNGDENTFRLGTLGLVPGAGGLTGGAQNIVGPLQTLPSQTADVLFPNNGWATRSNFFKVPEGLIWRNQSNADSQLNIVFTATRAIQILSGGSPENNVAVVGVDDADVWNFPEILVVGVKAFLIGQVVGPRTRSA